MQIANRLAGYSLGEADLLRRAMGKKKAEEMAKQRERFVERRASSAATRRRRSRSIFDLMEQFAGYGFNKSHSAAYAYLAYLTAYLKAHYPVEFMAALLTSETGNTDKVVKYINECREMGITVLPPDVNVERLELHARRRRDPLRPGRGQERGRRRRRIDHRGARARCGRFTSLYEFCERVDLRAVNRRVIESLIKAGAMDSLGGARSQLFAAIDGAMESGQTRLARPRERPGRPVRAMLPTSRAARPTPLPERARLDRPARSSPAKRRCSASTSPATRSTQYREKVDELAHARHGRRSKAWTRAPRSRSAASSPAFSAAQQGRQALGRDAVRGLAGTVEAVVFATNYERLLEQLVEDRPCSSAGTALPEESGPPKISVQDIVPLEMAARAVCRR